jgi:hypothetical protein
LWTLLRIARSALSTVDQSFNSWASGKFLANPAVVIGRRGREASAILKRDGVGLFASTVGCLEAETDFVVRIPFAVKEHLYAPMLLRWVASHAALAIRNARLTNLKAAHRGVRALTRQRVATLPLAIDLFGVRRAFDTRALVTQRASLDVSAIGTAFASLTLVLVRAARCGGVVAIGVCVAFDAVEGVCLANECLLGAEAVLLGRALDARHIVGADGCVQRTASARPRFDAAVFRDNWLVLENAAGG